MADGGSRRWIESERLSGPTWLVALHGEHDLSTSPELELVLDGIEPPGAAVVVDLSAASFVDSSVIGAIVRFGLRCPRLVLAAPAEGAPRRVIDLLQLDQRLPVFESRTAAIAHAQTLAQP